MKQFFIKLIVLLTVLFIGHFIEVSVLNKTFKPLYEHISFVKSPNKIFINTEQGRHHSQDSIFIERNLVRLHTKLHETASDIFECEEAEGTKCYISAISCSISDSSQIKNCFMLKGYMPIKNTELAINALLANRLSLNIGDKLCIKTPISNSICRVSGITKNPNGFPDFDNDTVYYAFFNTDDFYKSKVNGTYYTFSNTNDAFISEPIKNQINAFQQIELKYAVPIFVSLFILDFCILICLSKLFTLKNYYKKLISFGRNKRYIRKTLVLHLLIYFVLVLFFSLVTFSNKIFLIINSTAEFFAFFLFYIIMWGKLYGIVRIKK